MPVIIVLILIAVLYFGWGFWKILFLSLLLAFGIPIMLILGVVFGFFVLAMVCVLLDDLVNKPRKRRR